MTVLIVSAEQDVHAQAVKKALNLRNVKSHLLNLSTFPTQSALIMEYSGRSTRFLIRTQHEPDYDLEAVKAVWWRRPQPFVLPAEITNPANRRFALSEAETAFQGMFRSLRVHWVNSPSHDAAADHKPWQLALAQRVGLSIPITMITNDPKAAHDFWAANPGHTIHKQFIALPDTWRETRRLLPEDIAHADTISYAPVIFQHYVDAVADIRVIIIGDDIYAAEANIRDIEYPQDVRMNKDVRYTVHQLPYSIIQKLQAIMRQLNIVYSAIDLRLTPDGDYVFLEINPAGQFLYIEEQTGQAITKALARNLETGHKAFGRIGMHDAY